MDVGTYQLDLVRRLTAIESSVEQRYLVYDADSSLEENDDHAFSLGSSLVLVRTSLYDRR